jgi:hypothetical protein
MFRCKQRLDRLERQMDDAFTMWLRSLPEEVLWEVAGLSDPQERAFLASLPDEALDRLISGQATVDDYLEWRAAWERTQDVTH